MVSAVVDKQAEGGVEKAQAPLRFSLTRIDRRFLASALVVLLAVRLAAMFWVPLTDSTEARYAEIARKMLETGDWITPQFDYGVPFWGKPPLHTWLSALGMEIFGVGAFGARILILATTISVLGLVFAWVQRYQDRDQALLSTVVLASSVLFFGSAAFVMTDMVMVLGTTLSMVAFYNCATDPQARRLWGHLFFVGIAIGLLAKGPVALVVTVLPILGWLVTGRRWRFYRVLPWRSGLLLALVLTLPWYIAAEIKTPGFLRYFLVGEHFERFVVSGWTGDLYGSGHARPKGMIWLYALAAFLPWTLFAMALFLRPSALRRSLARDDHGWLQYLALWSLSALVLFTPAANILAAYALPSMPAAAVALVTVWAGTWGAPGRWARRFAAASIMAVAGLSLVIAVLAVAWPQSLTPKTERDLVAAAHQIDSAIQLHYWGGRSYSAEFYTRGQVEFTTDPERINALADNDRPDAVAVPLNSLQDLSPLLASDFFQVGQFGRRVLFAENGASEIAK
jgi:4-amino-4-deoxy-L-arabinose transferase-like glycosyltransferase